ncbi:MAG: hypothetical protein AAFN00_19930 [Cyanobacteria bacterium J06558_2]
MENQNIAMALKSWELLIWSWRSHLQYRIYKISSLSAPCWVKV